MVKMDLMCRSQIRRGREQEAEPVQALVVRLILVIIDVDSSV